MAAGSRRARVKDVHDLAGGMPFVTVEHGTSGNPVYQVGGKSFVFFRNPRPDAVDPDTGERYPDVIVIWVPSEADKLALVQDERTPFFTTPHFDGHLSVLVRGSEIGELTVAELTEVIQDERSPFFTTSHFDGHLSVLIRGSQIGELTLQELTEVVQDAWLCRASARRAASWLTARGGEDSHAGRPG